MFQRLPYQSIFSAAAAKSGTGRLVSNTQLSAALPAGGVCSVAPIKFTLIGSVEPDILAWPRR
jgi:hypothetical protein